MFRGQLIIGEDRQLSIVTVGTLPIGRMVIEPESTLEIHLGSVWIEGRYAPYYDNKGQVETPLFVCENRTFCVLYSGMAARLLEEQP